MKIAIGNDHAGLNYKIEIKKFLKNNFVEVVDMGTNDTVSCDYPLFAYRVCKEVINGNCDLGILICGTGIGMSIASNKIKGIRACCCSESLSSKLSREHNDANVLCFGERVVGIETAKEIVDAFIKAKFQGDRHIKRLNIIKELDENRKINV